MYFVGDAHEFSCIHMMQDMCFVRHIGGHDRAYTHSCRLNNFVAHLCEHNKSLFVYLEIEIFYIYKKKK